MLTSNRTFPILLALATFLLSCSVEREFTPPQSFGPPLRIGNRAYLLTWQRSSSYKISDLLIDIWAFDLGRMTPVYRNRLQSIRGGALEERSILGVHSKILWLLMPDGPYAVALDTGALAMNPDDLARLNPELRGLLPKEKRAYKFTAAGLSIKTIDAQAWHVHPDTFLVTLKPNAGILAGTPPGESSTRLLDRGIQFGDRWIGLLTGKEAEDFAKYHVIRGLDFESKRKLYSAEVKQVEADFGPTVRYSQFKALTPEFLAPAVLAYKKDPGSIFILHKDVLEDKGRFYLTRFSEPAAKVLWTVAMPLSKILSVLPDPATLLFHGSAYETADSSHEALVSVNWETGALTAFDQLDNAKHPISQPQH